MISFVGAGPALPTSLHLAVDPSAVAAYVTNAAGTAMLRIDLPTGDRTVIADGVVGTGPALSGASAITVDSASGLVYVANSNDTILSIDPTTFVRTLVSGPALGVGSSTGSPFDLAFDPTGPALLAAVQDRVIRVLLATGDRSTITSPTVGIGAPLGYVQSVDRDPTTGLLWLLELDTGSVVVVDPATGDRVVVSK